MPKQVAIKRAAGSRVTSRNVEERLTSGKKKPPPGCPELLLCGSNFTDCPHLLICRENGAKCPYLIWRAE
jgi:hypothetical protein